ncbi:hypothetical protein AD951_14230 [Acetobacter malorum]|uniref:Uncharacterized protein n=1 Tax=Acetobacter malorum TaxID=178901 RepID=A0A149UJ16_9PROT|nr:hypothetical protein AD951_14230 [Acetobacter malorum]
MAPINHKKREEEPRSDAGPEGRVLFQRAASVSTSPLLWKGPEDRRIRLQLMSVEDAEGQAQSGSLAVFLGVQPITAQQAGWGAVRIWSLSTQGADHGGNCACCQGGGQLGRFLISLIQERARGKCFFFRRFAWFVSRRTGRV